MCLYGKHTKRYSRRSRSRNQCLNRIQNRTLISFLAPKTVFHFFPITFVNEPMRTSQLLVAGWGQRMCLWVVLQITFTLLFDMGRIHAAKDFVEQIKRESSKFVKETKPGLDKFYSQRGYGTFSVSPPHRASVEAYIRDQQEHHRVRTFQEEYRAFLVRYQVEFDEQYVWD